MIVICSLLSQREFGLYGSCFLAEHNTKYVLIAYSIIAAATGIVWLIRACGNTKWIPNGTVLAD